MTSGPPVIGAYLGDNEGYADQFLVRQAEAIGAIKLTTRAADARGGGVTAARQVGMQRQLARAIRGAGRRAGFAVGLDPLESRRLARAIANVDVVYTMFLHRVLDVLPTLKRRGGSLGLVVHGAGSDVTQLAGLTPRRRALYIRALRATDLITCGSEYLSERLSAVCSDLNQITHYIGVPVPPDVVNHLSSTTFRAIIVSRLHPIKGVDRSIRAFNRAVGDRSDVELMVVGDGPLRAELERLAGTIGLSDRVVFTGRVPQGEVIRLMMQASVLLQHNVRLENGADEGLGGSLLEAAAVGLPVVATRTGGTSEAVIHDVTGLLGAPEDIDTMSMNLRSLYESTVLRARLGRNGRRFVEEFHNSKKQDARLSDILRGVVIARDQSARQEGWL